MVLLAPPASFRRALLFFHVDFFQPPLEGFLIEPELIDVGSIGHGKKKQGSFSFPGAPDVLHLAHLMFLSPPEKPFGRHFAAVKNRRDLDFFVALRGSF